MDSAVIIPENIPDYTGLHVGIATGICCSKRPGIRIRIGGSFSCRERRMERTQAVQTSGGRNRNDGFIRVRAKSHYCPNKKRAGKKSRLVCAFRRVLLRRGRDSNFPISANRLGIKASKLPPSTPGSTLIRCERPFRRQVLLSVMRGKVSGMRQSLLNLITYCPRSEAAMRTSISADNQILFFATS